MLPFLAYALLATTVASTVTQVVQARRAEDKNEKAQEAQNRIQARRAYRERLDQLRQTRIAAAQVANAGAGMDLGSGTSATSGQVSSVGAQYGSNVSFINSNMRDANTAMELTNSANRDLSRGAVFSAIGQVAQAGFTTFGGAGAITGTKAPTPPPTYESTNMLIFPRAN